MMRHLVDVEREFGRHIPVLALVEGHHAAILAAKAVIFNGNREIYRQGMPVGVADVMRKCANREGKFIGIVGVTKEVHHKIAGADIVRKI